MPRLSPNRRTAEEQREAIWLRAIEAGDSTVADLMRVTGLSRSSIYERLNRARENRPCDGYDEEGSDDLPYLALTDDPSREVGDWYDLAEDQTSIDRGRVRIGNHSGTRLLERSVNGGRPVDQESGRKDYKPDPNGLKGGVG